MRGSSPRSDEVMERAGGVAGGGATFGATSLELPKELPFEDWKAWGVNLRGALEKLKWWIGDWLVYGREHYGESRVYLAAEELGMNPVRLRQYEWMSRTVEKSRRRPNLSYTHHRYVAALPAREREKWLDRAEKKGWNSGELGHEVKSALSEEGGGRAYSERDHVRVQAYLTTLGTAWRYDIWIPRRDRSARYAGRTLGHQPGLLENLPDSWEIKSEKVRRVCEEVDVIWIKDGHLRAAFEVEHTTPVYSGLLRMSDLTLLVPNLKVDLFVVVPNEKVDQVRRELERPTFVTGRKPVLSSMCRVITFEGLGEAFERHEDAFAYMGVEYLRDKLSIAGSEPGTAE